MDEEDFRKLDEIYLKKKIERMEHDRKTSFERRNLLDVLKKLNNIPLDDPDSETVSNLSKEISEMLDKVRREEFPNIFPLLEKSKKYFMSRELKETKKRWQKNF